MRMTQTAITVRSASNSRWWPAEVNGGAGVPAGQQDDAEQEQQDSRDDQGSRVLTRPAALHEQVNAHRHKNDPAGQLSSTLVFGLAERDRLQLFRASQLLRVSHAVTVACQANPQGGTRTARERLPRPARGQGASRGSSAVAGAGQVLNGILTRTRAGCRWRDRARDTDQ